MKRLASLSAVFAAGLVLGFAASRIWNTARTAAALPGDAANADTAAIAAASPAGEPRATTPPGTGRTPGVQAAPADDSGSARMAVPAAACPNRAATSSPARPIPADDGTVRIPRKFLSKIQCTVFNSASNCVTDEIVELLGITPGERERLDRLIATTRTRIEEHELGRATVTEQSPTRVVLKIAGNADEGRDQEDAFAAGVQETLGDRAETFLDRAQIYQATMFSNFGRNDTTLTVTRDENSNLLRVQSVQQYSTPNGGHGSVTSTTMSEQMPERWKKFFQTP